MYDYFISFVAYTHDGSKGTGMVNACCTNPITSMNDLEQIRKDLIKINNFKDLTITFYSLLSGPQDEAASRRET